MRTRRLVLLVGPPGSGKSTLAATYVKDGYAYINQDTQGGDHFRLFEEALARQDDVVVDRMNFSKAQRSRYSAPATSAQYITKIVVLHVPYDTCYKRIEVREGHPTIKDASVGGEVLNFFFRSYEKVEDHEADVVERLGWSDDFPLAIVSDLDGTLCNLDHRLHYMRGDGFQKGKKRWKEFFETLVDDKPNEWCREILWKFQDNYPIVLASGRPGEHSGITKSWLSEHNIQYNHLFLRQTQDYRPDTVAKEIILDFEILTRYNVFFVIDDRASVVKMWRDRGLTVLACADGDF